jgi:hypothetical protein
VHGTEAKTKTIPSGLLTQKQTTCNHSSYAIGLSYELLDQSTYCRRGERYGMIPCGGTSCNRVFVNSNKDPILPDKIAYKPSVSKPLYKCVNEHSLNEDNASDNVILCTHALCKDCWSKCLKEMPPTTRRTSNRR